MTLIPYPTRARTDPCQCGELAQHNRLGCGSIEQVALTQYLVAIRRFELGEYSLILSYSHASFCGLNAFTGLFPEDIRRFLFC